GAALPLRARRDRAPLLVDDREAELQRVLAPGRRQLLAPFHDERRAFHQLLDAEPAGLHRAQAIEIEMRQRHAAAVLVHQTEGRTSHPRLAGEAARQPGHEAGLACAERTFQQQHVADPERGCERFPEALRLRGGARMPGAHRPRGSSVTSGSTISSIEMPPCWKLPRNCRSNSWKRVGYTK